jgi:hypothetical protein
MEFDEREFKRKFPHLYEELEDSPPTEEADSESPESMDTEKDKSGEYIPEFRSYIRRARTNDEAVEVVNYLRKRGELSEKHASGLLKQIKEQGVRSFGSLKTWGYYEREFRKKTTDPEGDNSEEVEKEFE